MNAKKLNGYRASHKNKWLFIKHGILSVQELSLLEFYADIFDFDPRHETTVGLFPVNFKEIAEVFSCSQNTVRNWHSRLLQLGLIKNTDKKNIYQLSCYSRYITPGRFEGKAAVYAKQETNQSIEIILQNFGIDSQLVGGKVQIIGKKAGELGSESSSIAISSYKEGISSDYKK